MQLEKLGIRQNGVHPVLGKAADQIETLVQKKCVTGRGKTTTTRNLFAAHEAKGLNRPPIGSSCHSYDVERGHYCLLFQLDFHDGPSFCDRYLAESRENGANGTYRVYAISNVAVDEIQEDKLTAFIDGVSSSKRRVQRDSKIMHTPTWHCSRTDARPMARGQVE